LLFYSDHSISTRVERLDEAIMEASRALHGEPSGLWQYSETSCWVRVPRRKLNIQRIMIQHNDDNIMYDYYCDCYDYYYYYLLLLPLKPLLYYTTIVIQRPCGSAESSRPLRIHASSTNTSRHVQTRVISVRIETQQSLYITYYTTRIHTYLFNIMCSKVYVSAKMCTVI